MKIFGIEIFKTKESPADVDKVQQFTSPGTSNPLDLNDVPSKGTFEEIPSSQIMRANSMFWPGVPLTKDLTFLQSVVKGLKLNPWVYKCCKLRADSVSSVPWYGERLTGVDDNGVEIWERLEESHPLSQLIKKPNPYMTWGQFLRYNMYFYDLGGISNMVITRAGIDKKTPRELMPIMPDLIAPIINQDGTLQREWITYQGKAYGIRNDIHPDDILCWRAIDPAQMYWGLSPLKAAATAIDTDNEATEYQRSVLRNGTSKSVMLMAKNDQLSPETINSDRETWNYYHAGAGNAGKVIFTSGDYELKEFGLNPNDMNYAQLSSSAVQKIAAVFGVPYLLLGADMAASTYDNLAASDYAFWSQTILPLLTDLCETLNAKLVPEYGEPIRIKYDVTGVPAFLTIIQKNVQAAQSLFNMGVPWRNINDKMLFNFPPHEGDGISYLPANMIPANQPMLEEGTVMDNVTPIEAVKK